MRQQNSNLPVQSDPAGRPVAVLLNGAFRQVTSVIDSWQWAGDWVNDVSERHYWLVSVEGGGVLELYEETDSNSWVLSRVPD